jgi:hypothetical protein
MEINLRKNPKSDFGDFGNNQVKKVFIFKMQ